MRKRIVLFLIFTLICESWSVPKPMESVTNYNVIMMHGALGSDKGIESETFGNPMLEASLDSVFRGEAHIGKYGSENRLTYWLSKNVFEEPDSMRNVHNSYLYSWRSFTNPANSSRNNAVELGDRTWNKDGKFGRRRALVEEAQEVKVSFYDSVAKKYIYGQAALDSIRQNSDLYRQLASRYILVGHSMGGVVAREWIQNSDYYHGEVDKVITLDSPHEGTGALNMQLAMQFDNGDNLASLVGEGVGNWIPLTAAFATATAIASKGAVASAVGAVWVYCLSRVGNLELWIQRAYRAVPGKLQS